MDRLVLPPGVEPSSRLAAFWPVGVSDWIAVVQERRESALNPVRQIRNGMLAYGLPGFLLTLVIVCTAWRFVRRSIQAPGRVTASGGVALVPLHRPG